MVMEFQSGLDGHYLQMPCNAADYYYLNYNLLLRLLKQKMKFLFITNSPSKAHLNVCSKLKERNSWGFSETFS